jgi:predicted dehydrogenase
MTTPTSNQRLRFVVTGVGANIWGQHLAGIEAVNGEIVGVADLNAEIVQQRADELDCPFFLDAETMLAQTRPDVSVIITPHPCHAEQTIASLEAGAHVLVEKPIAAQVQEADAMVAAAQRTGRLLAVNFQQRLRPEVIAARALIASGQLGQIQNADIKMTWTRTAIYYRSSTWRGTWNGEGGGVLLNQAPHELDLLCYLLGMPMRVMAWTRNLIHPIETEDTIQAVLEWDNGALGSVHISTAEAGQPQRFEIIGTGGRLALRSGGLDFGRFDTDVREFIATSPNPFSAPELRSEPVALEPGHGDHVAIYRNLQRALAEGTPVAADGASALQSLELANAMNYSNYTGETVTFPLDRQKYADLLADLMRAARAIN